MTLSPTTLSTTRSTTGAGPPAPRSRARPGRGRRTALTALGSTALALVALATVPDAASAHVRVHADATAAGSFSQLTFRVPNESDTARTTKVTVSLPADRPLLYVSTKPIPGWTATAVEAKLPRPVESYGTTVTKAVRTVTWTADDAASAIGPGEYQEFSISAGPLPAAGDLLLPTTQTYSDGEVVSWNEPPSPDGTEPEHPAPLLTVTGGADQTAPGAPAQPPDWVARGSAIAGLVVAAAALVVATIALRRSGTGSP